jgi:acyl-CoA reductase-like NAD-dependent aldehyde dehydrogenase
MPAHTDRAPITKTWKLFVGGAYPRSESGRVVPLDGDSGDAVAYVAAATRKDLRDAVEAARSAQKVGVIDRIPARADPVPAR